MVRKAVIPAAGYGTRFLPATKAQPKEMLPVIDTPVIQYVVQEAIDSGIDDILIISGKGKNAIENHFDRSAELEEQLRQKGDEKYFNEIRRISDMANIHYIRQKELNGLGDAIGYARRHTADEPFAVLLGDTIVRSVIPVTQQLIDIYEQYHASVIGVESVDPDKVDRYGIIGGRKINDTVMEVDRMVEKPEPASAPSNQAIAGRYILTPEIFSALDQTPAGKNNELQLTDAMRKLLERESIYSYTIEGKRYDIGNKLDYIKTTIEYALARDEFRDELTRFINNDLDL